MSEVAAVPGRAPRRERGSRHGDRTRTVAALAALVVLIVGIWGVWASLVVREPHVEHFWLNEAGDGIEVLYWTGSGDTVLFEHVSETDEAVIVDIRTLEPMLPIARTAIAYEHIAEFDLDAPLGDRQVLLPGGGVVDQVYVSWATDQ